MVLWTENFQHVENKTFSFAYNLKWLCFAVGLKRTPDHVQVKVSEFFSHKGAIHIMSRDTFLSNRKLHFSWGGYNNLQSIRLEAVHHCFGGFIDHAKI